MGRLGADAASVLEAARGLARKHRHEALEPEHLLLALLLDDRTDVVLTERAVDGRALREHVEARLAEWPASGLYRDANVVAHPSEALTALVGRAGGGGLLSFARPIAFIQLARAACNEPRLAKLLRQASLPITTPPQAIAQAQTFALSRREGYVSVFHLFHVLAEQQWARAALADAGIDEERFLERLVARLDEDPRAEDMLDPGLEKLPALSRVLAATLRTTRVDDLLQEQGSSGFDFMRALVRASGAGDDTLPEEGADLVDIVFHDDDFTTMEFVVLALHRCFALTHEEAVRAMTRIHGGGAKVVKTCPASEARWRLEKARAFARSAKMPLRITWSATASKAEV